MVKPRPDYTKPAQFAENQQISYYNKIKYHSQKKKKKKKKIRTKDLEAFFFFFFFFFFLSYIGLLPIVFFHWGVFIVNSENKKVREKSRECHNHKPQPILDTKRKQTKPNMRKSNKHTKSTKTSSLFPKRGNGNAKNDWKKSKTWTE